MPRRLICLLLVSLLWLTSSCASIEHVSLLRAEQQRFSAAAIQENHDVKRFLFPGQHDITTQIAQWDGRNQLMPVSNVETLESVCQEYGYVNAALDVLLAEKGKELQQDNLLGVARALHLFATWRVGFCRPMLNAIEARPAVGEAPDRAVALTEVAQRATSLAADEQVKGQLGARDLLLLRLIPGIARYEAATIQIVRDRGYAQKPEADRRQSAMAWIGQMIEADREIEQGFSGPHQAAPHLVEYYLSTRRVVLLTANNIEVRADLVGAFDGPLGSTSWGVMKAYYARIDNFEDAVKQSGLTNEAKAALTQRLPVRGSSFRSQIP
jgi:hypothetical protein